MEKNIYKESFRALIAERICTKDSYIGTGNPNSEILIVGREGACEVPPPGEICFVGQWAEVIKNNESIDYRRFYEENPLKGGETWAKYQKLHDYIFENVDRDMKRSEINFEERIFTTEMNINRAERTQGVSTDGMQKRKDTFFKHDFIQQFPVVILACGDYIKNNEKIREIDEMFGVTFHDKVVASAKKEYAFWTHYNSDKTKLVIHTRQLSTDIPDDLLKIMAKVIKEQLNKA